MWTVVYIAPNRNISEAIKGLLSAEGLLVSLRPIRSTPTAGGDHGPVEVMVPESEIEEAHEILSRALGS
ncbi:MAG: glutamate decarboxylase [Bacillota bacterium]